MEPYMRKTTNVILRYFQISPVLIRVPMQFACFISMDHQQQLLTCRCNLSYIFLIYTNNLLMKVFINSSNPLFQTRTWNVSKLNRSTTCLDCCGCYSSSLQWERWCWLAHLLLGIGLLTKTTHLLCPCCPALEGKKWSIVYICIVISTFIILKFA